MFDTVRTSLISLIVILIAKEQLSLLVNKSSVHEPKVGLPEPKIRFGFVTPKPKVRKFHCRLKRKQKIKSSRHIKFTQKFYKKKCYLALLALTFFIYLFVTIINVYFKVIYIIYLNLASKSQLSDEFF
jgi:hypothetical protein